MKVAFLFFVSLAFIADVYHNCGIFNESLSNSVSPVIEASLDQSLAYIVVTASILGVIKLKKSPH